MENNELNNELNLDEMEEVSGGKVRAGGLKKKPGDKDGFIIHQITATDTMIRIAEKYGTTVSAIMACTPSIKDKRWIRTGYYIYVPKR